ncbi:Purple acid phosphatase 3 [Bienertia sinuspersici]
MESKVIKMNLMLIVISVLIMLNGEIINAKLPRLKQKTKEDGSLSLLVVGDWGRNGDYNQSLVASQMGIVGEKMDVDFIISTGDNFYDDGLTGVHDPAFEDSFTNIYTAPSLQKRWFTVLGNHDYRGDVLAHLSPVLRKRDSRWVSFRSYIVNADIVDFFFVDTTPFQDKYFVETKHTYDWRGVIPRQRYLSNLLKEVDEALKKSTAKWKFVIGHHTMMSAGHHGNTIELVAQLLPILETNNNIDDEYISQENRVDLYINGHDHCLEHISSSHSSLQFLTSGGGSKSWRGDVQQWNEDELKLYYDGQGFMSMQVTQTELEVMFFDIFGNILHKWTSAKPDHYSS